MPVNILVGLNDLARDATHMSTKRTHVVLSERLVKDIDTLVGSRQRSRFLTQAAEREVMRLKQLKALDAAAGAWKDKDHPELKQGSGKWVKELRRENERRIRIPPTD